MSKATTIKDPICRMIEKRSPDWSANSTEWAFFKSAMEGGAAYAPGNLYRHPLEATECYVARLLRAVDHHYNVTRLVIDSYEGYLFQVAPTLNAKVPECIKAYSEKAAKDGSSLVDFLKETSRWLEVYGVIWVATDKPVGLGVDRQLSALEESEAGLVPYSYLIHPQNVLDGKIEDGKAVWLMVQEDGRDDDTPESSGEPTVQWRIWERDRIRVYKPGDKPSTYILASEEPNPLGLIPIIPIFYGETKAGFACPGLVADIAHIDRAIFNKSSLLDDIHYKVTFPQLTVPYDGELFGEAGGLSPEGESIIGMGLDDVIPYSSAAGAPAYMHYPAEPATVLREAIKEMVMSAIALALLDGEAAVDGVKAVGSGVSRSYIFQKLNKRLASIADTLEVGFYEVFKVVQLWQGDTTELLKTPIDFPETFEVKGLTQEITDILAVLGSGIKSKTFESELYKRMVRMAMPKLDEELLAAIDAEIEQSLEEDYQMQGLAADAEAAGHTATVNQLDPAALEGTNAKNTIGNELKKESKESGTL